MTADARELRYVHQSPRERRGYFIVACAYALLVVGTVVYQLVRGRPFEDVAPRGIVRLVLVGLILLLVVKYRDAAASPTTKASVASRARTSCGPRWKQSPSTKTYALRS